MIHNSFPRGFSSGSRDGLMSKEDKLYLDSLPPQITRICNNIDFNIEKTEIAQETADLALQTALDKVSAIVFDTKAELDAWLAVAENKASLKTGTTLLIRDSETPDYWWDGTDIQILETQKVDLSDYVTKTSSINNTTVTFTADSTLQEITSGSTVKVLFGSVAKAIKDLISLIAKVGSTDISTSGSTVTEAIKNISTSYLKLSGGTVNGPTNFTDTVYGFSIKNTAFTKGNTPSVTNYWCLNMYGTATGSNTNRLGMLQTWVDSDGITRTGMYAYQNVANSSTYANIWVGIKADGTIISYAPTPATSDNGGQIATTAFVKSNLASYLPLSGGTLKDALNGTTASFSGAISAASGTFSGTVTAPTFSGNATSASKLGSATVGGAATPMYLNAGVATACSSTVGGTATPVYMKAGVITACSSTVGGTTTPVYMKAGVITACSYTIAKSVPSNAVFTDTNTAVTQTNTTTSADYRLLFSANANDTTETTTARKSAKFLVNPSTGKMTISGELTATKVYNAIWNDYAEWFEKENLNEEFEPGDIVSWGVNGVTKSTLYGDTMVAGVYSDSYGHIIGGEDLDNMEDNIKKFVPLGIGGRLYVKVTGKVKRGDLIISSDIPGVGITHDRNSITPGTVIGKALENKDTDEINKVKILIMLA